MPLEIIQSRYLLSPAFNIDGSKIYVKWSDILAAQLCTNTFWNTENFEKQSYVQAENEKNVSVKKMNSNNLLLLLLLYPFLLYRTL
jgi:hypothetical protein